MTYVLSQIVGAFIGMAISYGIRGYDDSLDMYPRDITLNVALVTVAEFTLSIIFMTIYMYAKNDWVSPSMDFGLRAYTMMGVQYLCAAMSLRVTGGALNPSIGLSAVIFRDIVNRSTTNHSEYLVAYLIGPILAAVVAGVYIRYFAYKVTPPNEPAQGSPFLRRATLKKGGNSFNENDASGSLIDK